jgi:hypothetical protein
VNQLPIAPRTLIRTVPVELERIITKALEKNPKLRCQTASDVRADLQRLKRDLDRAAASALQSAGRSSALPSLRASIWLGAARRAWRRGRRRQRLVGSRRRERTDRLGRVG